MFNLKELKDFLRKNKIFVPGGPCIIYKSKHGVVVSQIFPTKKTKKYGIKLFLICDRTKSFVENLQHLSNALQKSNKKVWWIELISPPNQWEDEEELLKLLLKVSIYEGKARYLIFDEAYGAYIFLNESCFSYRSRKIVRI